jgi:energy-coupling factor transport system substrate-specific component
MTWQLGSFALLALALAAGFAWYERARPDARVVALVGTLAAFAALGRIAFAALPNVKPTTDIVLISGYALGGAPGFVIGALAGLTSNFFFGQGPWTPWQMAAWGATGILGAGLATVTLRRISRWPLALVCAVVGFAFAATQDFGDWVTFSDHSFAQLGVYLGRGIGFDLVHAGGCLVFALAFGPALTRSVQRFTTRLQVTWQAPAGVSAMTFLAAILLASATSLGVPSAARAASPTSYLLGAVNPDGGFGPAPGQASSTLYSGWAALGLSAEGINPQSVSHGGPSLLAYVTSTATTSDVGSLERTILALRASGSSPGQNLLDALERDFGPNGAVSGQVNLTAFGVLALRAAGVPVAVRTVSWLLRQQNSDGGFSFATAGPSSDVDDTGAALEALSGAGGSAVRASARAVGFLRSQQDRDGGFPAQGSGDSNAQSTSWAVQGLIAAGVDPDSVHRRGGATPLQYLSSLIAADGHVRYSAGNDETPVWVTAEAAMALARKPLPLAPAPPVGGSSVRAATTSRTSAASKPRRARTATAIRHPLSAPARRTRAPARAVPRSAATTVAQLAADAGLATALALAPIGLG